MVSFIKICSLPETAETDDSRVIAETFSLMETANSHTLLTYPWDYLTHMNRRTHVVLSEQLVKDIDALVGSRKRSTFM